MGLLLLLLETEQFSPEIDLFVTVIRLTILRVVD